MGSKTKTVGGGQATGTANAFNQWMLNGLQTGNFGSGPNSGVGQANAQTNTFGNAVNTMLSGSAGNVPANMQQWFNNAQSGNGGVANMPNAPTFRETNFRELPTNVNYNQNIAGSMFGQGGSFGGGGGPAFGAGAAVNFDPSQVARTAGVIDPNGGQLLNVDYNSNPETKALVDMQNRGKMMDAANIRARFGALGSGLSTGANRAESDYLANAGAQNTLALGELGRQMQAIDMQNRGQNYQALLQQMGIQSGERNTDTNAALQAAVATANNATQASLANAGNANQFGLARMQAELQARGMDADNAFRAAQMMSNNLQTMNQNDFGNNQSYNNFAQQSFGQNSQNVLQNQNLMNQFGMNQAQIGQGLMGLGNQSQQAMMGQLMNQFGNINQLGTPQAQVVEQQNPWLQGAQALGGLAMGAGSLMTGMGAFKGAGNLLSGAGNLATTGAGLTNMANTFGGRPQMPQNWNQFNPQTGFGGMGGIPLNRMMPALYNTLPSSNFSYAPRVNTLFG